MRWNQQKIVAALSAVPGAGRVEATTYPWGDYTTNAIVVHTPDGKHRIHALGFNDDFVIDREDAEDTDVVMVELSDGTDSRGGLQSTDPQVIRLFGELRIALVGMGATVVDQMKDYF